MPSCSTVASTMNPNQCPSTGSPTRILEESWPGLGSRVCPDIILIHWGHFSEGLAGLAKGPNVGRGGALTHHLKHSPSLCHGVPVTAYFQPLILDIGSFKSRIAASSKKITPQNESILDIKEVLIPPQSRCAKGLAPEHLRNLGRNL